MASSLHAGNLFSVQGLVDVITGGGSGIGLMMARALDANGAAAVYILGRREQTLQTAASQALNGKIVPIVTDFTSKDSLAAAAARVASDSGHVDVVITKAGASSPTTYPKGTSASNLPFIEAFAEHLWYMDA